MAPIELGLIDLPMTASGYAEVVRQLADVDARAKALGSKAVAIAVTSTGTPQVTQALGGLRVEAARLSGTAVTVPVVTPNVAPALAALGAVATEKGVVGGPIAITITPPNVAAAIAGLNAIDAEKARAATPVAVTVTAPDTGAAVRALAGLDAAKADAAQPVVIPVPPPNVGPATTAAQAFGEGLKRAAAEGERAAFSVTAAWERAGPRVAAALAQARAPTGVASPANPVATAGRRQLGPEPLPGPTLADQQAERVRALNQALAEFGSGSGRTAEERAKALAAALAADAEAATRSTAAARGLAIAERDGAEAIALRVRALNELRAATDAANQATNRATQQQTQTPAPVVGPRQLGPATPEAEQQFVARANANAQAAQRAAAAQATLATETARAAQQTQQAAAANTNSASASQRAVTALQAHATQQQRSAQAAQLAAVAQQALAQQTAGTAQGQQNATAATQAQTNAQVQQTRATQAQAAAQAALTQHTQRFGAQMDALSPKWRSAANGLTAVAFAATAADGSVQSLALGAGLAATSLASMATGPVAAWAAGIGAGVVAVTALVGILREAAKAAPVAKAALDHIGNIDRISSAEEALARVNGQIKELNDRVAQGVGQGFWDRMLPHKRPDDVTLAQDFLDTFGLSSPDLRRLQTKLQEREALEQRANEVRRAQRKAEAEAVREIAVQNAEAENRALAAIGQQRLADEAAQFALGRRSLDDFLAARLRTIEQNRQREVSALALAQAKKSEPVVGESPDAMRAREAEAKRITQEIIAANARASVEATQTIQQREADRRRLNQQILALEQREQEAAGDASKARIAIARAEAVEIARALVQGGVTPADANLRAQAMAEAQAMRVEFETTAQRAQRLFDTLDATRARIQAEGEAAGLTQVAIQERIAEAEREQVPALEVILKRMAAIAAAARESGFSGLADQIDLFVQRAMGSLAGLGRVTDPLVERWRTALNQLELMTGNTAQAARKAIEQEFAQTGITVPLTIKAEALGNVASSIDTRFETLGLGIGDTFGSAIAEGLTASMVDGGGNFFKAFGNTVLQGLGNIFVQMGAELITYGLIMAGLLPFLSNPFTSGPAAILAGGLLVATGAALGAIATNNSGRRTGGGRAATTTAAPTEDRFRVTLDPDRRLREARERERTTPTVVAPATTTPQRPPTPVQQFFTIIGPDDPSVQRTISDITVGAADRGLPIGATGRRG